MRTLGLDYGAKRIGVAVCDELGVVARGIGFIKRQSDRHCIQEIAEIAASYQVEKIVIGYPIRTDGVRGVECERIDEFALLLTRQLSLPVIKWDETLTTKEAEEILMGARMSWKERKKHVDALAAALILQGYLAYS